MTYRQSERKFSIVARSRKHSVKYRLTCEAPKELTKYNKIYNEEIEQKYFQQTKFQPHLSCTSCEFLETKRMT